MREGRWTTVTPSQFDHEREALEHVRRLLPDAEPYRAWSNFTFTADTGHVYEVDLLVAARSGLYLIEIKSLRGRLTSSGANWVLINRQHPYLRQSAAPGRRQGQAAAVAAGPARPAGQGVASASRSCRRAVFLSIPGLQVDLPDHQLHWVYGPEPSPGAPPGPLPGIWSGLLRAPRPTSGGG